MSILFTMLTTIVLFVSLNDSKLAGNDVLSERDTLDRLSGEAMQQQIDWLTDWLATR